MSESDEATALSAEAIPAVIEQDISDDIEIIRLRKTYEAAQRAFATDRHKTRILVKEGLVYLRKQCDGPTENGRFVFKEILQNRIDVLKPDKKANEYNPLLLALWVIFGKPEKPSDADKSQNTKLANAWKLALLEGWNETNFDEKYEIIGGLSGMSKECQSRYPSRTVAKRNRNLSTYNPPVRRSGVRSQNFSATAPDVKERPPVNPMYRADSIGIIPLPVDVPPEYAEGKWRISGIISGGYLYIQHKTAAGFFPKANDDSTETLASELPAFTGKVVLLNGMQASPEGNEL